MPTSNGAGVVVSFEFQDEPDQQPGEIERLRANQEIAGGKSVGAD
jgi:hypothetical protein